MKPIKSGIKTYILTTLMKTAFSYIKKKENREKIMAQVNKGRLILKSRNEQKKIKKND